MATHNQVRTIGFLLCPPKIVNENMEDEEKIIFKIRTVHRDLDNYTGNKFQDLLIYYDESKYMEKMKKLNVYDIVDIKGVFNVLTVDKRSKCQGCGAINVKEQGTSCFVYPISFFKLNALETAFEHDADLPERILDKYYAEVSNQALIIGTLVNEPEFTGTDKYPCCRYRLGVDRKYYIRTQSDIEADYPWVYSYGKQAEMDYKYLKKGALILMDGFIQNREVVSDIDCSECGQSYQYPDVATEFVPYSVEYLNGYFTEEELAQKENEKHRRKVQETINSIHS